ncbi:MAG: hypothetical protein U0237_20070 [Thermoleophilia bacterium]
MRPEELTDFSIRVAKQVAEIKRRLDRIESWLTPLDQAVRDLEDITVPDLAERLARLDRKAKGGAK